MAKGTGKGKMPPAFVKNAKAAAGSKTSATKADGKMPVKKAAAAKKKY